MRASEYGLHTLYYDTASIPSAGDVAVYVFDINQPSLPTPFNLFLGLFLSLWPFQRYFIPPTILRLLTLSFRSGLCLTGPLNYIFLNESLPQP